VRRRGGPRSSQSVWWRCCSNCCSAASEEGERLALVVILDPQAASPKLPVSLVARLSAFRPSGPAIPRRRQSVMSCCSALMTGVDCCCCCHRCCQSSDLHSHTEGRYPGTRLPWLQQRVRARCFLLGDAVCLPLGSAICRPMITTHVSGGDRQCRRPGARNVPPAMPGRDPCLTRTQARASSSDDARPEAEWWGSARGPNSRAIRLYRLFTVA
jgi:hypothetical protein